MNATIFSDTRMARRKQEAGPRTYHLGQLDTATTRKFLTGLAIIEASRSEKSSYDGTSTSQAGRGEKRTHDHVDDDEEDERPYVIEGVKEVNIKKFRTKGNCALRFNNTMADVEIKDVHERLHQVFQHILDDTVGDVLSHDQVRLIIHSTQLKNPIAFPFKSVQNLTTERILSEFQRVIQSNFDSTIRLT